MRWRPFDKPLDAVTSTDLDRLVSDVVEESFFIEYKSAWTPKQIAKTIAGFANTEGGTLILGIRTEGRRPVEVVGIDHKGDLGESLDHVIRAHIAPTPDTRFQEVRPDEGLPSLVVDVPSGPSRPYLLTQNGAIVRRTETGTEPADREFLDRLLREGRAGERWARSEADFVARDFEPPAVAPKIAVLCTFPAMDGGLSVAHKLFRQESWETLLRLAGRARMVRAGFERDANLDVSDLHLEAQLPGFRGSEVFRLRVDTTGTITSTYSQPNGSPDLLKLLVSVSLPLHKSLFTDTLDFHGSVVISGRNAWSEDLGDGATRSDAAKVDHPVLVQIDDLDDPELEQALHRAADRSRGWWYPEP